MFGRAFLLSTFIVAVILVSTLNATKECTKNNVTVPCNDNTTPAAPETTTTTTTITTTTASDSIKNGYDIYLMVASFFAYLLLR